MGEVSRTVDEIAVSDAESAAYVELS
jgi:hypothetical protein